MEVRMIATALGFLTGNWKTILIAAAVAFASFFLGQCRGEGIGRDRAALALEKANRKALEQKGRADALAANQRLTDTIAVNTMERNLRDAIASTPDSAPDDMRVSLGCERLRRAGVSTAALPACRGPRGGAETSPAR
jgi:hypothetical protein